MNKLERTSRPGFRTLSLAALLLGCCIFPAVADDGKQRYVAGSGSDQGDCLNRFRPCRTLSYAISKAGKADVIKVAEGSYTVRDTQQLYDVLSVNGRINAGFSKYSGYSERNATSDTVLVGVPPEFRERFEAAGFTVIADRKGLEDSAAESAQMSKLTAVITASEQSHSAAPCAGGSSGGFPCQSMSLGTHLSLQALTPAGTRGNSVWGFTDLNTGREYAFMGLENGVAVVDLTNPDAAEQVGLGTGSATTWRDIKVYQTYDANAQRWRAYAYVTADRVTTDFLLILDLSGLPNSVQALGPSSDHRSAHNVYMINADYTFGLAQTSDGVQLGIAGSNLNTGNFRLYSLAANPRSPQLLSVANFGYAHDLSSFAVKDARKNTQCVNAQSQPQCQVLSDFNENTVDIWDITNPGSPQRLASQPYPNAAYVHSGWWTEDGRYLLVHDELDEQNFSLNTTIRVFDLADLRAPVLAGSWVGPTRAIDHNGYVRGNRYYVANYSEGLTVLDITDPRNPTRIGFFDTFPASAQMGFVGAWAAYPFYPSGAIAIGDINSGLYIVRNEALATPRGSFVMANAALGGTEGQALSINVNRNGGSTGAVTVDLEVLYATAGATDASIGSTTLSWADGDAAAKSATVNLAADAQAEGLELLMVRLRNPQGGATIGYPETTHVSIAESGSSTTLRLLDHAPAINETRAKALITLTRHGSANGEARASYRTIAGGTYNGVTATQGELVWADGDASGKVVTVQLNPATLSPGQSGTFQMEFFNAVNASLESNGQTIAVLPLTVTVNDPATVTPPPPPPPQPPAAPPASSGGGGGAHHLWLSLLLGLLAAMRALGAFAADTTEELARQVREAEAAFAKTMADRDLQAFGKFLAEDAVFFGPKEAFRGKAAVIENWKAFYQGKDAPFSWKPENVELANDGTLAHSSGPVFDPQGKHVATFNSIWRREADGSWKVVFDKGCGVCNCKP
jgi:choice-of-anchor B domain-containing protein